MSKPETKLVLGRTFTESLIYSDTWECYTRTGLLSLRKRETGEWDAVLHDEDDEFVTEVTGRATEADAILALQSQLRKMAELEVAE